MTGGTATRGRPLIALVLLMVAWVGVRAIFWNTPAVSAVNAPGFAAMRIVGGPDTADGEQAAGLVWGEQEGPMSVPGEELFALEFDPQHDLAREPAPAADLPADEARFHGPPPAMRQPPARGEYRMEPSGPVMFNPFVAPPFADAPEPVRAPAAQAVPVRVALAHQMLWMAAISRMPLPESLFSAEASGESAASAPPAQAEAAAASPKRWSADSWMLRRGGGGIALTNGFAPATYGASQFGAVLRYRLDPASRHRPSAYLRTTAAMNGSGEKDAALGLSARPLAGFPVAMAAEMRVTTRPGSRILRPALLAWTEMAPFKLPMNARGEFYAQGGYVGGKYSTPFADGQLRIDRGVARLGRGELRAGGGTWGGVQKGASRLDVGPTATMGLPISRSAFARIALDWRFRLAGNAQPKSGPALTLSAGF